jgi:hypothetical protein
MTRQTPRRTLREPGSRGARRWAALACGAALGVAVLSGCSNFGNGDSQTSSDTVPGPPLPKVELPKNPELVRPYGVQISGVNSVPSDLG